MRQILISILPILLLLVIGEAVGGRVGYLNQNDVQNGDSEFSGRLFLTPIFGIIALAFSAVSVAIFPIWGTVLLNAVIGLNAALGGTGRDFNFQSQAANLAKRVLTSEQCVERVACAITNFVPTSYSEPRSGRIRTRSRVQSTFKDEEQTWNKKMLRGFDAIGQDCSQFNCSMDSIFHQTK